MEENAITALQLAGDEAVSFGLWSLIEQADPVVKAVMAILVLASIWCWTIIFDKAFRLMRLRRKAQDFERAFWSGANAQSSSSWCPQYGQYRSEVSSASAFCVTTILNT